MAKLQGNTRIYGNATVDTNLTVSGNTISTNSTTGALIVTGGVGVGGNIHAADYYYSNGVAVSSRINAQDDSTSTVLYPVMVDAAGSDQTANV
jgi:hypothetical protein